jgi:hypothetical protein
MNQAIENEKLWERIRKAYEESGLPLTTFERLKDKITKPFNPFLNNKLTMHKKCFFEQKNMIPMFYLVASLIGDTNQLVILEYAALLEAYDIKLSITLTPGSLVKKSVKGDLITICLNYLTAEGEPRFYQKHLTMEDGKIINVLEQDGTKDIIKKQPPITIEQEIKEVLEKSSFVPRTHKVLKELVFPDIDNLWTETNKKKIKKKEGVINE